ncbi:MAG TPA: hypothetical protein VK549_16030, partial [Acidimicrobiia bacterium]|nr:hypothetical protein [Acidimicrobiia bacterium]
FVLMLALGAATAFSATKEYRSTGTITVESSTVIGDLTETGNTGFNFDTPATVTARNINEKLRTNEFLNLVAAKLNVDASEGEKALLRTTIADSVSATADGDQLVRVGATTEWPELSVRLAEATIDSFIDTINATNVLQSNQTVEFFTQQVDEARAAYEAAEKALSDYLVANNIEPNSENVSVAQQAAITSLQADLDRKESQYETRLASLDQANLVASSTQTETEQRIRRTDTPELPEASETGLKNALLTVIIFGVLGALLTLASVIASAALDRTIRVPSDITGKFGLDVLAVVPDAKAR